MSQKFRHIDDEPYHEYPDNDPRGHEDSEDCPCAPTVERVRVTGQRGDSVIITHYRPCGTDCFICQSRNH